jgi:hypothetical protein
MNELELEVGKTYLNGYGEEVTITELNDYEMFVSTTGNWYMEDGSFSPLPSKDDLVKEKTYE